MELLVVTVPHSAANKGAHSRSFTNISDDCPADAIGQAVASVTQALVTKGHPITSFRVQLYFCEPLKLMPLARELIDWAKKYSTIGTQGDERSKPLFAELARQGYLGPNDVAYVEWQGAWEHDVIAVHYGPENDFGMGHWLNVDRGGHVTLY